MFVYGALVANKDEEARADIDAILNGDTPPSELRERAAKEAALMEFAYQGEVAGSGDSP